MKIEVRKQKESLSGTWGVFVNGELIEGGFFEREAAMQQARTLVSELLFEEARIRAALQMN